MQPVGPIHTLDLFPQERASLLELLSGLSAAAWNAETVCDGWSVKDIAAHLLGDDMGLLSGRRDGFRTPDAVGVNFAEWNELIGFINRQNDVWVRAMRRLSPRVLIELLRFTGQQTQALFESLDMNAVGGTVNWASAQPGPVWMELAREYTERWTHQQHIRDAVNQPGLKDRAMFGPVLDAFVRALPRTYASYPAPEGTIIACTISGEAGGAWLLRREPARWVLYVAETGHPAPNSSVSFDQETAWRLFTRGIGAEAAHERAAITGDRELGLHLLNTVSMLV